MSICASGRGFTVCMTNVSYERVIIVLSFPDISFVILLFVFQRFEIKSGFPFFNSHCIYGLFSIQMKLLFFLLMIGIQPCRHLIQFGVVRGLIRRLHQYPVKLQQHNEPVNTGRSLDR